MQDNLTFSTALVFIKQGSKLQRKGWNGKGMYLFLVDDWKFSDGKHSAYPNHAFVAMKTADGTIVPWLCSQTDMLAEDWQVLDG